MVLHAVTKDLVDEWLALDDSSGRRLSVLGVSRYWLGETVLRVIELLIVRLHSDVHEAILKVF